MMFLKPVLLGITVPSPEAQQIMLVGAAAGWWWLAPHVLCSALA